MVTGTPSAPRSAHAAGRGRALKTVGTRRGRDRQGEDLPAGAGSSGGAGGAAGPTRATVPARQPETDARAPCPTGSTIATRPRSAAIAPGAGARCAAPGAVPAIATVATGEAGPAGPAGSGGGGPHVTVTTGAPRTTTPSGTAEAPAASAAMPAVSAREAIPDSAAAGAAIAAVAARIAVVADTADTAVTAGEARRSRASHATGTADPGELPTGATGPAVSACSRRARSPGATVSAIAPQEGIAATPAGLPRRTRPTVTTVAPQDPASTTGLTSAR